MKCSQPSTSTFSLQNADVANNIESAELQQQLEVVVNFLPDYILVSPGTEGKGNGVLLLIEVQGLASLCHQYSTTVNGGTCTLTSTLNSYVGSIIEIIHFYGGDVLTYSGDEFLVCWNGSDESSITLHNAIICGLLITDNMGNFRTDTGASLLLKVSVNYGEMSYIIIGKYSKCLTVHGSTFFDMKYANSMSSSGELSMPTKVFRLLDPNNYNYTFVTYGFIKIHNCIYTPATDKLCKFYEEKSLVITEICNRHMNYQREVLRHKKFDETAKTSEEFERLKASLPTRASIQIALSNYSVEDFKPFINSLIHDSLEEKTIGSVTNEIREISVLYVDVMTSKCEETQFRLALNEAYAIIQNISDAFSGTLIKLFALEWNMLATIIFGLRGSNEDNSCRNALLAAQKIYNLLLESGLVKLVTITVCYGLAYCGVIGHPQRKEYVVIGYVVSKAEKISRLVSKKVICDYSTYKTSKLSTKYFKIASLSGVKIKELLFEFNPIFTHEEFQNKGVLVGRDEEYDTIYGIVNHAEKFNYFGICFHGPSKIGKSKLIHWCYRDMLNEGYPIASIDLCQCGRRPYYCISNLYKQLFNMKNEITSKDYPFVKEMPTELWDFSEVLQCNLLNKNPSTIIERKFKILSLFREIVKHSPCGYTVIFIDNIQYIDVHSLDIIETIIAEGCLRLIAAGEFEEQYWNVRWKISLNNHIKLLELGPLKESHVLQITCDYLQVNGVHKKLLEMLQSNCGASPGIVEKFLLELSTKGYIEFKCPTSTDENEFSLIIPPSQNLIAVKLKENFSMSEKLTPYTISMNTISKFTPYQLNLVKISCLLGEIFDRASLAALCSSESEITFARSIKYLFIMNVFECASSSLTPGGFKIDNQVCHCIDEEITDKSLAKEPKIAFCKLIHFKDNKIRNIVHKLIPRDVQFDMFGRIVGHIESQKIVCVNCKTHNGAPLFNIAKFSDASTLCSQTSFKTMADAGDYIYEFNLNSKFWDSTTCSCLEILLQIYNNFIVHSCKLRCIEHQIFFLLQYARIMEVMDEYEEAISLLKKALDLCKGKCDNTFKVIHIAKINILLAKVYLCMKDIPQAKKYLVSTLKTPLNPNDVKFKISPSDLVGCLNLVTLLFIIEKEWNMAKLTCHKCLLTLKTNHVTLDNKCEAFYNAFLLYAQTDRQLPWKRLEKLAYRKLFKKYKISSTHNLFAISKLLMLIFEARSLTGKISYAIAFGYRVLSLNMDLQSHVFQVHVAVNLVYSLILVKRIEDSIGVARILYTIGKSYDETCLLAYYVFNMELILETSFMLEPFKAIQTFAKNYFIIRPNSNYTQLEQTLLLYLYNYHLRNNKWGDICIWKSYIKFTEWPCSSLQSVKNFFKFTESQLIAMVRNESIKRHSLIEDLKTIEGYLKSCKSVGQRWTLFLPRYLHLKAYFMSILRKKGKIKKYLKKGILAARENGNMLEYCWMMQSKNCWEGGFSFEGDRKYIDWKLANTYTPLHWSQIMYGLPSFS